MIDQMIQDSWKEAIREDFKETGVLGAFSFFDNPKAVDHNLIKTVADKQSKSVFREVFKEQLLLTKNAMKEYRDAICATMEEGPARDSFSNYEFSPDELDELFLEILKGDE